MLYLIGVSFCVVVWGFAGVLEAFPNQQGLDRTSNTVQQRDIRSNGNAGPTEFFTPKPPQYYDCFGTDVCETGIHFCSEIWRRCEKCSDYPTACGTNFQNPNCTQYCMKVLVERKCNETVIAKLSFTTTENYTQKTSSSALPNNPETYSDWMWICVTSSLGIALAISLSCNIYQHCHSKQAKQTRCTNEEHRRLLKDRLPETDVNTSTSLDFIDEEKTSDCPKQDDNRPHSLTPSAPLIGNENLDQEETSIKSNNKRLPSREPEDVKPNLCRERQDVPRDTTEELRDLVVDADMNTSSGYSSVSSTLSRKSSDVTMNTTININIQNGQTGLSTTPTGTKKNYIQPEIPREEVPYSVEETDADFNRGKRVSDEDENGILALPKIQADIDDLKKSLFNG